MGGNAIRDHVFYSFFLCCIWFFDYGAIDTITEYNTNFPESKKQKDLILYGIVILFRVSSSVIIAEYADVILLSIYTIFLFMK